MNRRFFKRTVLAAVSLALLYYNIAWAVLRCPHQENHSDREVVLYDTRPYTAEVSHASPSQRQVNLDCTGPKYHTEILAGPSTELPRLTRDVDVASRVNVLLAWSRAALNQVEVVWLIALSDKVSSAALPFGLPRYLSLSVFRF